MKQILILLTFLMTLASCSNESSNVSGLISGETSLSVTTLSLTTLSSINSANQSAYTVAGTCTTQGEQVEIKINTTQIETTATCNLNIFAKVIDLSSVADSTNINIEVNELAFTDSQTVTKDTIDPTIDSNSITGKTYSSGETVQLIGSSRSKVGSSAPRLNQLSKHRLIF